MDHPDWKAPLGEAFAHAVAYLDGLPERPVRAGASLAELRAALGGPLPEEPQDPAAVVAALVAAAEPGIVASGSGRYFGFVVGGTTPAALAADWLATAWDQNAGLYVLGPAAAVVEEVAGAWITDLLGLPAEASVGFVTGAQMANFTALAAALHTVLGRAGWDLGSAGLWGAPRVRILAGEERHGTIDRALRFLGVGTAAVESVPVDARGRLRVDALDDALDDRPTIVCAQVGEVNTGAVDPVGAVCEVAHPRGAWVHVDGAFGLWAAASPRLRPLVAGAERADSWATDAHKWLNVPYDCGLVFCADPSAHRAAMGARGGYLVRGASGERDPLDHNPEHSRRARGFAVYAGLRALGRSGVADLVERCCAAARRFADDLGAEPGVEILNEVVLNQVLVRFGDSDELTRAVVDRVQRDGTCWLSGTVYRGRAAMRISVSNWSTDEADVARSVAAIRRCARDAASARGERR
jgi:glutamate/tyrosine decarboxylase-like PLP-dependent enzyme